MRRCPLPPPTVTFRENYDELISTWRHPRVAEVFGKAFDAPPNHVEDHPGWTVLRAGVFGRPATIHLVAIRPPAPAPERIHLMFSSDHFLSGPGWQSPDFLGPDFVAIFDLANERLRLYNYKPLHLAFYRNVPKWLDLYGRMVACVQVGETIVREISFIPVVPARFREAFLGAAEKSFGDLQVAKVNGDLLISEEDLGRPL